MAELISAKDLPVTEAEEVDVLCVDAGELKRKPATGLGGGGNYVLKIPISGIQDPEASPINIVISDNYDDFAPILFAGGNVALDVSELVVFSNFPTDSRGIGYFQFAGIAPGMGFVGIFNLLSMEFQVVAPNGTWTPPAE